MASRVERCGSRHAKDGYILACLRAKNHAGRCADQIGGLNYFWDKPFAPVEGAVRPGKEPDTPSYRPDAPSLHSLQRGLEAAVEQIERLETELAAERVKTNAQGRCLRNLVQSQDRFMRGLEVLAQDEIVSEQ